MGGKPRFRAKTVQDDQATLTTPADLVAALKAAGALARWEALSFSHQREHVEAIEEAKKPETRARRIANAVRMIND